HTIGRRSMSSEIRLTPTSYIVLGLIDAAGEATPYDLKQTVGLSLGNFWSLPHAQLYAEPERLAGADRGAHRAARPQHAESLLRRRPQGDGGGSAARSGAEDHRVRRDRRPDPG